MKLILDIATVSQIARKPTLGASSVPSRSFLSGSPRSAVSGLRLQSLPAADRERSSVDAPAPGPGGVSKPKDFNLDEANREWFVWRFGEDA